MKNRSQSGGFTLTEILLVLALIVIVGRFALMISFNTYRGASFHTDRAYLISALQHARAQAENNVCAGSTCTSGASHGVSIETHRYVVFQGSSYATRNPAYDEPIEANPTIIRNGLSEIIFAPGSGDATPTGDIVLSDPSGRSSTITIGNYGQIFWNN
jgi:prepilin-type N-terminal cleavage/methylation domain-containing protein